MGRTNFSTYIRGSTGIDFILASPEVVTACTAAGYDPYNFRFSSDHDGMYLVSTQLPCLGMRPLD
jgi:hypothetical protein